MLFACLFASADDLYVLPGAGSAPGYYDSIQEAIDAADNGDIILISPDSYVENLQINKSITLKPFGVENFELIGELKFQTRFEDDAEHHYTVNIIGMTIQGVCEAYELNGKLYIIVPVGGGEGSRGPKSQLIAYSLN